MTTTGCFPSFLQMDDMGVSFCWYPFAGLKGSQPNIFLPFWGKDGKPIGRARESQGGESQGGERERERERETGLDWWGLH